MKVNQPEQIGDIFKKPRGKKPPAYQWQELALRIIDELRIPGPKRTAVFKVCKLHPRSIVEKAFNDTKELAPGEPWRYFFKVIENIKK
ncbi:MAG: hypothetical protein A2840_02310 [Candidatus Buchananbacteria bacterium RIFCSPHIGHO2_01_FULL_47_11b]|uniref:Uncharacterized protein n=1 Tax=Candidatus Buchananbacteria bacterium RIFCSPHIGHO2_01_FULL_47_11b TaxID=1797537 RepID=A0A1G1Y7G6_9BACT|nr:MAG: hypothetical protein A2840_02310 [Candidatus Buchananbacteria bacterium RIFCSPHIGHO2_01_FULL_47_11b]